MLHDLHDLHAVLLGLHDHPHLDLAGLGPDADQYAVAGEEAGAPSADAVLTLRSAELLL